MVAGPFLLRGKTMLVKKLSRIVPDPSDATRDFYIPSDRAKDLWLSCDLWAIEVYQNEVAYTGNFEMLAKARRYRCKS
jgi:hypothetical protein